MIELRIKTNEEINQLLISCFDRNGAEESKEKHIVK